MKSIYRLEALLSPADQAREDRLAAFAVFNLGLVESLANGAIGATTAVRDFYHFENCIYVSKKLKNKLAGRVMSHGVQLPDLFDALPVEEAQREFSHELAIMRALCLQLLESTRQPA